MPAVNFKNFFSTKYRKRHKTSTFSEKPKSYLGTAVVFSATAFFDVFNLKCFFTMQVSFERQRMGSVFVVFSCSWMDFFSILYVNGRLT